MQFDKDYTYKHAAAGGAAAGALYGGIFAVMVITSAAVIRILR